MGLLKIVFLLFFFSRKKKQKKRKKKEDFVHTQLHLIVLYAKISDLLLGNAPVAVPTIFSLGFFSDATIALILLYTISLSSFHLFPLIEGISEVYLNDIVIACYGRRTATSKIRVQFWKTTVHKYRYHKYHQ
jgi:hypothetical protein